MSEQPGLSRRALLGLFRRPAEAEAARAVPPVAPAPSRAFAAPSPVRDSRTPAAPPHVPAASAVPPPSFSLESFYASRARSGEATVDGRIPVFSLREGLIVPQRVPDDASEPLRPSRTSPSSDASGASMGEAAREGEPLSSTPPPHESARKGGPPLSDAPGVSARGRGAAPTLGATVRVRTGLCLAWQGSFCTTCVERCPVEGAIVVEAGRPRVVAERCDGCGTCVRVCPAPLNAFELRPAGASGAIS